MALAPAPAGPIITRGDYVAAGTGLRDHDSGIISIRGIPAGATVSRAFLYWGYLDNADNSALASLTLNGSSVSGTLIGRSSDTCWGRTYSYGYRAEVTGLVGGNGTYTVGGVAGGGSTLAQGVSLVVVYRQTGALQRTVVLVEGNDVLRVSGASIVNTLSGFTATAPVVAKTTYIVGDGQSFAEQVSFTGGAGTATFDNSLDGSDGPLWDTDTHNVSDFVAPGDNSVSARVAIGSDCLMWVAQVFSVSTTHQVDVTVTHSGNPVANVVTTLTNVLTGEYYLKQSNASGVASFAGLPDGSYLSHARNMVHLGPRIDGLQMWLAPLPADSLFQTEGAENVNRVGVLYDPSMTGSWAVLSPDNYSRLTASPAIQLSGGSGTHAFQLRMQTGAIVNCTFKDASGNPISIDATKDRNVVLVLPFGSSHSLPPLPPQIAPDDPRRGLPRGILLGAATVIAGQSSCGLAGVPSTQGKNAVLETPALQIGGKEVVFVKDIQISDQEASGGATVQATMFAEPRRAEIEYLDDDVGDATGSTDIRLTTYGWGVTNDQVNETFTSSTRFQGLGYYSLYLAYNGTRARIDAKCDSSGCVLYRKSSSTLQVTVSGPVEGEAGTVTFEVTLPGVSELDFRVFTGSSLTGDSAPDSGLQHATRPSQVQNTWLITGE